MNNEEKITKELLRSLSPCAEGYKRFCELFPDGATLPEAIEGLVKCGHDDWGWWLFNACRNAGLFVDFISKGYRNSGRGNSGDFNSGDLNSGDRNSGHFNSGDSNSGGFNSGYRNSGCGNSGDFNSGDFNSGDFNSGHFNVDTPPTLRVFGKECQRAVWEAAYLPDFLYFTTTQWVDSDRMTDAEKSAFPLHHITGGFVRRKTYKEAFKESWERADKDDRIKVKDLPNFDAEIFYQISGIDLREGKDGD